MGTLVIGLGEFAIADTPGNAIRTFGLGSCVAVVAMHSTTGVVGMAHIVLPASSANSDKARAQPGYFADTAIAALFNALDRCTPKGRYIVKLVGGAAVLRTSQTSIPPTLDIGKRNVLATKKYLWIRGLGVIAEETGGEQSRSVTISFGSPQVEIKHGSQVLRIL